MVTNPAAEVVVNKAQLVKEEVHAQLQEINMRQITVYLVVLLTVLAHNTWEVVVIQEVNNVMVVQTALEVVLVTTVALVVSLMVEVVLVVQVS